MALNFQQSEATAAQRRFPLYLVDATDGITPETGEAAGQPQVSENGAAFVNTSATLTAIGNGSYYVELTAAELSTLGMLTIRFKSAATAEFSLTGQVVAYDPYSATNLGLSNLDATISSRSDFDETANPVELLDSGGAAGTSAAELVDDIFDEDIVAAHGTADTAGLLLRALGAIISQRTNNATLNALLGVPDTAGEDVPSTTVDEVWDEDATGHQGAGSFGETVGDSALTGVTIHSRVNQALPAAAPAGAGGLPTVDASNLLAGIQGTKNDFDDLNDLSAAQVNAEVDTALVDARLDELISATAGGVDPVIGSLLDLIMNADGGQTFAQGTDSLEAVANAIAALNNISTAQVNTEVLDVMNVDTITLPGQEAPPLTPTHRQAISWLYKTFRNRKTQTATQWSLLADDESTIDAKATVSDDATTAIKQEIVTGP